MITVPFVKLILDAFVKAKYSLATYNNRELTFLNYIKLQKGYVFSAPLITQ